MIWKQHPSNGYHVADGPQVQLLANHRRWIMRIGGNQWEQAASSLEAAKLAAENALKEKVREIVAWIKKGKL